MPKSSNTKIFIEQIPNPPAFSFENILYAGLRILVIEDEYNDENPTMTVTNDIHSVLRYIASEVNEIPELVVYKDSENEWSRLLVKPDGEFIGFMSIMPGLKEPITHRYDALKYAALIDSTVSEKIQH